MAVPCSQRLEVRDIDVKICDALGTPWSTVSGMRELGIVLDVIQKKCHHMRLGLNCASQPRGNYAGARSTVSLNPHQHVCV